MMRYQSVSPDCLPLPNGRKPNLRTCKEEDDHHHRLDNGRIPNFPTFEGKPLRLRPSDTPPASQDHTFPPLPLSPPEINGASQGGGDVLLQWGHNKRSRGPRAPGDDSTLHGRPSAKIPRRSISGRDKQAAAAAMPPPGAAYSRGSNLRPSTSVRDSSSSLHNRSVDDRSNGHCRPEKRSPPSPTEKMHRSSATTSAANGSSAAQADSMNPSSTPSSEHEAGGSGAVAAPHVVSASVAATEKVNLDLFEWPRIYISLSRKEKEEDFYAMKGTKLPQRPKKRAKNIDKTLQYCFPGMWLSDLTRGRYEVREKKCVKKQKRRGLKGMESIDSDSD